MEDVLRVSSFTHMLASDAFADEAASRHVREPCPALVGGMLRFAPFCWLSRVAHFLCFVEANNPKVKA